MQLLSDLTVAVATPPGSSIGAVMTITSTAMAFSIEVPLSALHSQSQTIRRELAKKGWVLAGIRADEKQRASEAIAAHLASLIATNTDEEPAARVQMVSPQSGDGSPATLVFSGTFKAGQRIHGTVTIDGVDHEYSKTLASDMTATEVASMVAIEIGDWEVDTAAMNGRVDIRPEAPHEQVELSGWMVD